MIKTKIESPTKRKPCPKKAMPEESHARKQETACSVALEIGKHTTASSTPVLVSGSYSRSFGASLAIREFITMLEVGGAPIADLGPAPIQLIDILAQPSSLMPAGAYRRVGVVWAKMF